MSPADVGHALTNIAMQLMELSGLPDWPDDRIDLMTRALFSSVHGMVLLGLERRISAVPLDRIEDMIAVVLRNVTSEQTVS